MVEVKPFSILSSRNNDSVTRPSVIALNQRATDQNAGSNITRESMQIAFVSLIDDETESETENSAFDAIEGISVGNCSFGDNAATAATSRQSDLNSAQFGLP